MALTLTVHAAVDFRNQLIGGVLVQAAISLHGILGGDEESGAGPVGVGAVVVVDIAIGVQVNGVVGVVRVRGAQWKNRSYPNITALG